MSKLDELSKLGQSIWYDNISRSLLTSGELSDLIDKGVRGLTSNPSIFEKAIVGSDDYDADLRRTVSENIAVEQIYESLVLKDIRQAADLLRPIYQATDSLDGYVSLEVSPTLANNTIGTVAEARRLFTAINRPNVMIKVPATRAGIPAIAQLIGAGVNINVTLIFGVDNYRSVAEAYLAGLERLKAFGGDLQAVASVASFFVSRVDTAVDEQLRARGNQTLQGKVAIANSKVAYALSRQIFAGSRWAPLFKEGARPQRLLWASTGTKNPVYLDTHYVDQLIGPHTVNTVPPATLTAVLNHGTPRLTLPEGYDEAVQQLAQLQTLGIDLVAVTQKLQDEGVQAFTKSYATLRAGIERKRDRLLAELSQAA